MNTPVIEYKPIGQTPIDALNWPLKATLQTTGWWQIDPNGSFFKNHITSRIVSATTLLFAGLLSVISKTALLLRDTFIASISAGVRIFRNEKINSWADKQPTGDDVLFDIRNLALSILNVPLSPIIGFLTPFGNYKYQVRAGLIPPSAAIQAQQEKLVALEVLPKAIKGELKENEVLSKAVQEMFKISQPTKKNSHPANFEEAWTDKTERDEWKKTLEKGLKGAFSHRMELLNNLHEEIQTININLLNIIKIHVSEKDVKIKSLRDKKVILVNTTKDLQDRIVKLETPQIKVEAPQLLSKHVVDSDVTGKKEKRRSLSFGNPFSHKRNKSEFEKGVDISRNPTAISLTLDHQKIESHLTDDTPPKIITTTTAVDTNTKTGIEKKKSIFHLPSLKSEKKEKKEKGEGKDSIEFKPTGTEK